MTKTLKGRNRFMLLQATIARLGVLTLAVGLSAAASAQTIKIGVVHTFSGPQATYGDFSDKGMRLYLKQHEKNLPAGVKIEIINRDDGGPNPDKAKQLAQELVVRDKVNILMGATFTPVALAIAPVADEAKIPFVITNAGTSMITTRSPNIVRFSFTLYQSVVPLGTWAAKSYQSAYTLVTDYAPGHDAEQGFIKGYTEAGGKISGSVRVPIQNQDFSAFMQRVKDAKPNALMVFVPGGKTSAALMKSFTDLGLREAGIKLIGPGDIVPDEELVNMGDEALGVTTVFHYSSAADRPANKEFVAAWKKEYGENAIPNFVAVAGYDAMAGVIHAIREQKGKLDTEKTLAILKTYSNPASPRGPISIDPNTRDIIQNEYLREVRRVNGKLANVEIQTIGTAVKDPWKEQQKK